ncbi:MAG TPA: hypothetical protein VNE42_07815 [Acidimicrobiales bacterium]|nr:hypothetical protein [Acidimicrobiales bacterium]
MIEGEGAHLVGHSGCHRAPSGEGMIEFGYKVVPSPRREQIASETEIALVKPAVGSGSVGTDCESNAPDNVASLATVKKFEFTLVDERIDVCEESGSTLNRARMTLLPDSVM